MKEPLASQRPNAIRVAVKNLIQGEFAQFEPGEAVYAWDDGDGIYTIERQAWKNPKVPIANSMTWVRASDLEILSLAERQSRLIYACIVAGKSAKFADAVMGRLNDAGLNGAPSYLPFENIKKWVERDQVETILREARSGNYYRLQSCFEMLSRASNLDLLTCTPEQLERFSGIGPKTARFFILWTRPGERHAALDVHVLRWLVALGYKAPKSTPSAKQYRILEKCFITEADARNMTPRELDHEIWINGSGYKGQIQAKP